MTLYNLDVQSGVFCMFGCQDDTQAGGGGGGGGGGGVSLRPVYFSFIILAKTSQYFVNSNLIFVCSHNILDEQLLVQDNINV